MAQEETEAEGGPTGQPNRRLCLYRAAGQLGMGHTGLNNRIVRFGVKLDDLVHPFQVQESAASFGYGQAADVRPAGIRDHRDLFPVGQSQHPLDLFHRRGHDHIVGHLWGDERHVIGIGIADMLGSGGIFLADDRSQFI